MSPLIARRDQMAALEGYHSPQVAAQVRLNTNESPFPPPESWRQDLAGELERIDFNRYPDRNAARLRAAVAELHGVAIERVFCANGSNEVIQCLLVAYGGSGRRVLVFEPTYALHTHIAHLTGTDVVSGQRDAGFVIDPEHFDQMVETAEPAITFLCSPNNPTGRSESPDLVRHALDVAPGLVVVDEAYGQFAHWSALELDDPGLVVVRTFSKTWAMAAARLGYLIADPEVVASCEAASLPYHLSAISQAAGILALRYRPEMDRRVAIVAEERGRVAAALADHPVESWPSDANFLLFRPLEHDARHLWQALLDRGVLVRDCSSWAGLDGCLRVTIGTPVENDRFLAALKEAL